MESRLRKENYEQEYQKFTNGEENDAVDIRIKLKCNCSFYLANAYKKLKFLYEEAEDPFMSLHNLGPDFRKSFEKKHTDKMIKTY